MLKKVNLNLDERLDNSVEKVTIELHRTSSKPGFFDSVNKFTKQFKVWGGGCRKMASLRRRQDTEFSGRVSA